jgi:two-component system NarL family sensor kinase
MKIFRLYTGIFVAWLYLAGAYSLHALPASELSQKKIRCFAAAQLQEMMYKESDAATRSLLAVYYYNRTAQFSKADSAGIQAIRSYDGRNKDKRYNELLQAHAYALLQLGFIDEAHKQYLRSYKYANETADTGQWIQSLIGLSEIYTALNTLDIASRYIDKSMQLAVLYADELTLGDANFASARYEQYLHNFSKALEFYKTAAQYYISSEANLDYARALMYSSACMLELNQFEEANEILNRVLFTFYNSQEYLPAAQTLYYLGITYMREKLYDRAAYYFELSKESAEKIGAKDLIMQAFQKSALVYELKGDVAQALYFHKQYQETRESVLNERIAQQINTLDAQYQNAQNEQRIKTLLVEQKLMADNAELKQRQQIILLVVLTLLIVVLALVWVTFKQRLRHQQVLNKQAEQIHTQEIQEIISRKEIETMNAVIETQENERKRIAADLHDHVGSLLASVKLQFKGVQAVLSHAEPELQTKLQTASTMLDSATNDIRRISHNLDSGVLNRFGLAAALNDLCSQLKSAAGLNITFISHYRKNSLPSKSEMPLYRCAQELITNAIKHAQAKNIEVQLNQLDDTVNLMVSDDGVGFDLNSVDLTKSLGWRNMKSRIEHLKGALHIDSNLHHGTTVIIELPYESYD